jgi:hypothetical protein
MAIKSRTLLGGNCESITAAARANVDGMTMATANAAAPTSKHLDLIWTPDLFVTPIG